MQVHPLYYVELLRMRLLHTHIFHNVVVVGRDNRLYSETRFIAVGSHKLQYYLY